MTETGPPRGLVDRVVRVRVLEQRMLEHIEQLPGEMVEGPAAEHLAAARALATRHLNAIDEQGRRLGVDLASSDTSHDRSDRSSNASHLEELAGTATDLVTAYGALYAAARLLDEEELADDLASPYGEDWRDQASSIADLLVSEVHAELLADGVTCRCECPACAMGACLCTRNSIDTPRALWGRPQIEPGDGIELRIAPRPGSEMARVGMAKGDRIVRVDGEAVRINGELQAALRKHPIGDPFPIEVERSGRSEEIRVARASGPP